MIISFKDKETERLFNGKFSTRLPQDIQRTAAMKLAMLNAATMLETLSPPHPTTWSPYAATAKGNTVSGSTGNGAYALNGMTATQLMWRSSTTTEEV